MKYLMKMMDMERVREREREFRFGRGEEREIFCEMEEKG